MFFARVLYVLQKLYQLFINFPFLFFLLSFPSWYHKTPRCRKLDKHSSFEPYPKLDPVGTTNSEISFCQTMGQREN